MPSAISVGFLFLGVMLLACNIFCSHLLHYLSLSGADYNTPPLLKDLFQRVLTNIPLRLLGCLAIYVFAINSKFFIMMISFYASILVLACFLLFITDYTILNEYLHKSILIAPFIHIILMPAAIVLAAQFCFRSVLSKYHNTVSVCIPLAVAFGGILAYSIKNTAIHMHTSIWAYALIFTATCSLCCFLVAKFYRFETGLQAPEKSMHEGKIQISLYILLFLAGALLGVVFGFPMLFSKPYFTEVLILSFGRDMSPLYFHWFSLSLFLLPAHYILKKIGFLKTMHVSILGAVFLVAVLWQNIEITLPIYSALRLIFACSSALILAPLFLIVHKAAQKTNSIYSPVLWTSWGYIAIIALRALIGQSHPLLPPLLVSNLMLLAVLLLYLFTIRMTKVEHGNC